ncbi:MAG: phosphatase PAP2 family protein [Nitrospirae bacterium]|nr:phosphatase PAP2 family protein [Nitrospirota bacterium]
MKASTVIAGLLSIFWTFLPVHASGETSSTVSRVVETPDPGRDLLLYLPVGLGLGYLIADGDRKIYRELHDHRDDQIEQASDFLTRSGDGKTLLGVVALSYGAGYFSDNAKLQETTILGVESLVISGLMTEGLKHMTGRQRPIYAGGEDRWNGPRYFFRADEDYFDSFPSGHATAAFALATSFALQYPDGWVPYAAYTWAAGVAASRVYNEVHWTSDILAGSAIGYFTARAVHRYRQKKEKGFLLLPRSLYSGREVVPGFVLLIPLP